MISGGSISPGFKVERRFFVDRITEVHLGIVFVVDSEDTARLVVAREELLNIAEILDEGSHIPIIVAANKQDLRGQLRTHFFALKRTAQPTLPFSTQTP